MQKCLFLRIGESLSFVSHWKKRKLTKFLRKLIRKWTNILFFIVRFTRYFWDLYYRSNRYDFRFKTNKQSESCYLTSYLWKINPTWPTRGASRLIEAVDRLSRSQLQRTLARLLADLVLFSYHELVNNTACHIEKELEIYNTVHIFI